MLGCLFFGGGGLQSKGTARKVGGLEWKGIGYGVYAVFMFLIASM
jgi:hypothetical protein